MKELIEQISNVPNVYFHWSNFGLNKNSRHHFHDIKS